MEDKNYTINDLAMMTGFTTRTLRNYINMGMLKGDKADGTWKFSEEDLDAFFKEPFVKDGLRIKHNSLIFDFLADRSKKAPRTCVVLDIPASLSENAKLSSFFCKQMEEAKDVTFALDHDIGLTRITVSGDEEQVLRILTNYKTLL